MISIASHRGPAARRPVRPVRAVTATIAGFGALAAAVLPVGPAAADTAPVPPVTLTTVSADALPTVQVDGVVWDQAVVGDRVYAVGSFTAARPAGAAAGTRETARANILAYSLSTGQLVTSWAPTLNAEGKAVAASADGTKIFVAGSFTRVNGATRYRVAALDATTGKLVPGWNVSSNTRVRSLAVSSTTLFLGGIFSTVNGQPRTRLAAVSVTDGSLRTWKPAADAEVLALVVPSGSGKVVAAGRFKTLNGTSAYGSGALGYSSGSTLAWPVNTVVRDAGENAAIYSLKTDGTNVYGTGYHYGPGGNLEGSFAARVSDGSLVWVNGCRGDTYDSQPLGAVIYNVSHSHDCSSIGANPEITPRTYQHAQALSTAPAATNLNGLFQGRPAPEFLHWLPTLQPGTYTGQNQAAWTIEGTSKYMLLGGEFTKVNGTSQQGLVRFAVSSLAPNAQGPQGGSELAPALTAPAAGQVAVSWKSAWDRDNRQLTYEVLRGTSAASATVVSTQVQDSAWWNRPTMSFTDAAAPAGPQTYRIRVRDAFDNTVTSAAATVTVP